MELVDSIDEDVTRCEELIASGEAVPGFEW